MGARSAVEAAAVAGTGTHELSRQEARRGVYADLGTAAFRFSRAVAESQQVIDRRFREGDPEGTPYGPDFHERLGSTLDDVAQAAVMVQLHGPAEIVDMAWNIYLHCYATERRLREYRIASPAGANDASLGVDAAREAASKARGVFLSNARAHLEGQPIPLEGEPYLIRIADG